MVQLGRRERDRTEQFQASENASGSTRNFATCSSLTSRPSECFPRSSSARTLRSAEGGAAIDAIHKSRGLRLTAFGAPYEHVGLGRIGHRQGERGWIGPSRGTHRDGGRRGLGQVGRRMVPVIRKVRNVDRRDPPMSLRTGGVDDQDDGANGEEDPTGQNRIVRKNKTAKTASTIATTRSPTCTRGPERTGPLNPLGKDVRSARVRNPSVLWLEQAGVGPACS